MKTFSLRLITLAVLSVITLSASAQRRSVAILGDSYSTFEGYITPASNEPWYFQKCQRQNTDVDDVSQTWWHQLCMSRGFRLEINNSYSGSTIGFTGYRGEDYSPRSFITRADNLGSPDIILVFGGTNDSWCGEEMGEEKWSDYSREDFYTYRPAMCYLAQYMKNRYPFTDIYFILNTELKPEVGEMMRSACARYGLNLIELHDISKQQGHPDRAGMKAIAEQVSAAIH